MAGFCFFNTNLIVMVKQLASLQERHYNNQVTN